MWFAAIVAAIWASAAVGAVATKNSDCFDGAAVTTIAVGIGFYLVHKLRKEK